MKLLTLPNFLTLTRLILSPLALPLLLVYLLPLNIMWVNVVLAVLFGLFSLTDFFDGYFARRFQQETALGKLLDPIADKSLVYSTLIALLAAGKIYFYWVVLLIGREFFIMGLRLVALEQKVNLPVSFLAKIKTAVQMVCFGLIILNPYQPLGFRGALYWNGSELFLLATTLLLSLYTAKQYTTAYITQFELKRLTAGNQEN